MKSRPQRVLRRSRKVELDPRPGLEPFRAADVAVALHVDDKFLLGIDSERPQTQSGLVRYAISMLCPSRGTDAGQPSSRSIRCRRASAGAARRG